PATVLRIQLVGATTTPDVVTGEPLAGRVNYLIGSDRAKWRTNVATYDSVSFKGVYPGIDLVYHGHQRTQLEYDFVVAPWRDPGQIALDFVGADRVSVNRGGELAITVGTRELRHGR